MQIDIKIISIMAGMHAKILKLISARAEIKLIYFHIIKKASKKVSEVEGNHHDYRVSVLYMRARE